MRGRARSRDRRNSRAGALAFATLVFGTSFALTERVAGACGGGMAPPSAAYPAAGATEVSPQTSIIVRSEFDGLPAGLALFANGSAVPLPPAIRLDIGYTGAGRSWFFQLSGPLMPSTSYTLVSAAPGAAGGTATVELTHFSTSASYDKAPGVAAVINGLRLWRAHFPKSVVGAGGCVFAEYEGYFDLDFTPGTVPGTPPDEVVSILRLSSTKTALAQTLVFIGLDELPGGFTEASGGDFPLPGGGGLSPSDAALWKPVLQADDTVCASIETFGRNDLAAERLQSNMVCVPVTSVDVPYPMLGPGGSGGAHEAGGPGGTAAGQGGAGAPGNAGTAGGNSGCSVVPIRDGGALAIVTLGLVAAARRRRRR